MAPPSLSESGHNRQETRMLEHQIGKSGVRGAREDRTTRVHLPEHYGPEADYYRDDAYYKGTVEYISSRDPDEFSKLSSTDPGGVAELLVRETRSWLDRRDNEFYEFEVESKRLEVEVSPIPVGSPPNMRHNILTARRTRRTSTSPKTDRKRLCTPSRW
jgi:hypothetical protein